jgi:hypothetical protein
MNRSNYSIVQATPYKCFIVDLDQPGTMSVTNDAERVVAEVLERHPGVQIIYRDTLGYWSELMTVKDAFAGFRDYTGELPEGFSHFRHRIWIQVANEDQGV